MKRKNYFGSTVVRFVDRNVTCDGSSFLWLAFPIYLDAEMKNKDVEMIIGSVLSMMTPHDRPTIFRTVNTSSAASAGWFRSGSVCFRRHHVEWREHRFFKRTTCAKIWERNRSAPGKGIGKEKRHTVIWIRPKKKTVFVSFGHRKLSTQRSRNEATTVTFLLLHFTVPLLPLSSSDDLVALTAPKLRLVGLVPLIPLRLGTQIILTSEH